MKENNLRRKFKWTEHQFDKLNKVLEVLKELENYKPLTLRQIYYQLVSKEYIENKVSEYTMLSGLIKHARIDGKIKWDDIEDRVRSFHDLRGWSDKEYFLKQSFEYFLSNYRRNLLQSQDKYIEVWIEKDALSSIFTRIANEYTVPVVVCRGFSSISFLNDFKQRLEYKKGKLPVMLYFGDFDPSGIEMLNSMKITLNNEMDINDIEFKRVALLKEDIFKYKLPHNPNALKRTDSRAKKHVLNYGELAVELDALRPDVLERKIKEGIENELDKDAFNTEIDAYYLEVDKLNKIKEKVRKALDL